MKSSSALESFSLIDARRRRNLAFIVHGSFFYVHCMYDVPYNSSAVPCTARVTGSPLLSRTIFSAFLCRTARLVIIRINSTAGVVVVQLCNNCHVITHNL